MKIKIDNRDLVYTIDTYAMFNGETVEDSEREHYESEYGIDNDDMEFVYDHDAIVKDLAKESVNFLNEELAGYWEYGELVDGKRMDEFHEIIDEIKLVSEQSPGFYNFTTDSYVAEWTINVRNLKKYCDKHNDEFEPWLAEQKSDGQWSDEEKSKELDYQACIMLDFYTRRILSEDNYNNHMWEKENEIYSNNMRPSDTMQTLIDAVAN